MEYKVVEPPFYKVETFCPGKFSWKDYFKFSSTNKVTIRKFDINVRFRERGYLAILYTLFNARQSIFYGH